METTFEQEKQKPIDLLLKTRELSTLLDIKSYINDNTTCIDCNNEYTYLESRAYNKALEDLEELINNKIAKLK